MDFFSRLLRRQPIETRTPVGPTPQQRLKQFKSVYNKLLSIWNNGQGASKDAFAAENHRLLIVRVRELLIGDTRGPTPHLCISFAFTNGVLRTLTQIGTAFCEPGIAGEVLGVLQLVVDSEEEAFLEDRNLADALPIFVEAVKKDLLGRVWSRKEELTEGDLDRDGGLEARMVEVLFGVTSAIRSRPLILKAWFRPEQFFHDAEDLTEADQPSRLEEFPLFYALIPYLTQEGRAGDFARMGILYIVESTSYSPPLERWLVEGDMAALVTSVLGALYSQLSTKLALTYSDEEKPPLLKFSSRPQQDLPYDVEGTSSQEFSDHLGSFLANLMFWQDILEHCMSREVKQTLLDHFQHIFLQKLLYPSLLGSSEAGSVAVLTYLRNILEFVNHYDLVHRMLVYLFGLPIGVQAPEEPASPIAKARRRKSEILLVRHAGDDDEPTPDLFNLSDLITNGLIASDYDTVTCTLRLLSTLLRRHHQESLPHLLKTRKARPSDLTRTYGGHEKEIDNWIALAENLTSFQDLEQSYERAVNDSKNMLELHVCTYPLLKIEVPGINNTDRWQPIDPYVLLPEDPITVSLVKLLDSFLTNEIETNLSLTQVLLDLAACGNMRLEGWILTEPSKYVYRGDAEGPTKAPEQASEPQDGPVDTGDQEQDRTEADVALEEDAFTEDVAIDDDLDAEIEGQHKAVGLDEAASEEGSTGHKEDDMDNPKAREEPSWHAEHNAPVFRSLDRILTKVELFHRQLQDFDILLGECKKEIFPQSMSQPAPPSRSPIAIATPMSRDPSHVHVETTPGESLPRQTVQASSSAGPSTPARGHNRSASIADRFASVFGSPSGKTTPGMAPSLLTPTPAARLRLRLSEASSPASTNGRPRSNSGDNGVSPESIVSPEYPNLPMRGHTRSVSLQKGLFETPTKPSYIGKRGLRGDDLGASPSPRLDRRVIPGPGRDGDLGTSLKEAIGSDTDTDSDSDGGVSVESAQGVRKDPGRQSGNDSGKAVELDDEDEGDNAFHKKVDLGEGDVTVGHLLTNVIILQEFVLEMTALVSVRATYFGEVRFR